MKLFDLGVLCGDAELDEIKEIELFEINHGSHLFICVHPFHLGLHIHVVSDQLWGLGYEEDTWVFRSMSSQPHWNDPLVQSMSSEEVQMI
jgi:hypothetical protein